MLHHLAGVRFFVDGRRGRYKDRLRQQLLELVEAQGSVVQCRRQAETVIDEVLLARAIAFVHAAHLWDGDVRFVDEHQCARRQVVDQRGRRLTRLPARQVARIVFDALAVADLRHHLEVEARALLDALRLDQLHLADEKIFLPVQLHLDPVDSGQHLAAPRDVVRRREHGEARELLLQMPGERIEDLQRLDLVVEKRYPDGIFRAFRRKDVEHVAAHAEHAALELDVVARVLHLGEALDRIALRDLLALLQVQDHAVILGRIADAVDGGDRGHDDAIGTLEDGLGGREPHLLDVLVDRRILLDVQVARRHIGLGLVVVVIGDEVFDRVVGKELAKFRVELRSQRLVGGNDHRRAPGAGDDVGRGEGLAGPGDAKQRLPRHTRLEAVDQAADRLRLIACGLVGGYEFETVCHRRSVWGWHGGITSIAGRLAQPCIRETKGRSSPTRDRSALR